MTRNERIKKIIQKLKRTYPNARCALEHSTPFELLAATILSAQCTDKRVNRITPELFKKYPTVESFASADITELEACVRTAGFYKMKAKNIMGAAKRVVEQFKGEVPCQMEDLIQLPGVGRKTANVILGNAFNIPGLTVDTHMIRLNNRLGLTQQKDPVKIEYDLMPLVPKKDWTLYSHLIINHGRSRCSARRPDCDHCEINRWCPSAGKV
jgi:endonuclease-3